MLGQPLFPYTGTRDLMPSCPIHPYPTLWFTRIPLCSRSRAAVIPVHRNARSDAVLSRSSIPHTLVHSNPFVLSILGSRYSRTQERSICCRLVPYLHTSHSRSGTSLTLSLSFFDFAFLSMVFWWVSRLLTDCIHYIAFFFSFFFLFEMIWVQSRVLVRIRS